jgi:hypothetical protein
MKSGHHTLMQEPAPFDEGFEARQVGDDLAANPYGSRTDAHLLWHMGWLDLQEHLSRRDRAWKHTFGREPWA